MTTWAEFEAAAPDLAAEGRRLLHRGGSGRALLATVRGVEPPRIHPISVGIVGDGLYAFILRGPKRVDLERDGRFALHSYVEVSAPDEFAVRGRATLVTDAPTRSSVVGEWSFDADETYALFEFSIDGAVLGSRASDDEWPPRYKSWSAAG